MQVIKPYLKEIAKGFWNKFGQEVDYPCDIFGAVSLIFPVDIVSLSNLSFDKVKDWLLQRKIPIEFEMDSRELHGFILTNRGSGIIFVNGTDNENERRFTVAHEISHFILDYKLIRDRAVEKFGEEILEVIDGDREPSIDEQIRGLLASIQIKQFTHILEKDGDGSFNNVKIYKAENDADELAIELLAPSSRVIKEMKKGTQKMLFEELKNGYTQILKDKYKLPGSIANSYALKLAYKITGGYSIINKLSF